jgi:hypothetical protein
MEAIVAFPWQHSKDFIWLKAIDRSTTIQIEGIVAFTW